MTLLFWCVIVSRCIFVVRSLCVCARAVCVKQALFVTVCNFWLTLRPFSLTLCVCDGCGFGAFVDTRCLVLVKEKKRVGQAELRFHIEARHGRPGSRRRRCLQQLGLAARD